MNWFVSNLIYTLYNSTAHKINEPGESFTCSFNVSLINKNIWCFRELKQPLPFSGIGFVAILNLVVARKNSKAELVNVEGFFQFASVYWRFVSNQQLFQSMRPRLISNSHMLSYLFPPLNVLSNSASLIKKLIDMKTVNYRVIAKLN